MSSRWTPGGVCAACGQARPLGALLAVIAIVDDGGRYFVCRPPVQIGCLAIAATVDETRIELANARAAREFDHLAASEPFPPGENAGQHHAGGSYV